MNRYRYKCPVRGPARPMLVELSGRHAVGEHRYAMVDPEDYYRVAGWSWKAKPSASGRIYAVRSTPGGMVRLHRFVMGLGPGEPGDVRFLNADPLDCRRSNLARSSRSDTVQAARREKRFAHCSECSEAFVFWAAGARPKYCPTCRPEMKARADAAARAKQKAARWAGVPERASCAWCSKVFTRAKPRQQYCSSLCRHRAKNERRRYFRETSDTGNSIPVFFEDISGS